MTDSTIEGPVREMTTGSQGTISYLTWATTGSRVPLILAHPVNTQALVWAEVAPLLTDGGRRPVIALDYRGHGESTPGGPYRAADYAHDVGAVVDAVGCLAVHLAGGSIGGAVGIELVAQRPGLVKSLVFVAAGLRLGPGEDVVRTMVDGLRSLGTDAWFAAHASGIVGRSSRDGVADELVALAGGRPTETVVEIVQTTFGDDDAEPTARALAATAAGIPPSLVVTGEDDPTCPPAMGAAVADLIDAEFIVLPGIGHLPMLEAAPEVARLINKFLNQVDGPVPA